MNDDSEEEIERGGSEGGSDLVVLGDVLVQCADEDHRDHKGEEHHDQDGVHDGEPVHAVRHGVVHRQIDVPARGPLDLAAAPLHAVSEDELARGEPHVSTLHVVVVQVLLVRARGEQRRGILAIPVAIEGMLDGERLDVEAYDAGVEKEGEPLGQVKGVWLLQ